MSFRDAKLARYIKERHQLKDLAEIAQKIIKYDYFDADFYITQEQL